jgi:hypothetical protein
MHKIEGEDDQGATAQDCKPQPSPDRWESSTLNCGREAP